MSKYDRFLRDLEENGHAAFGETLCENIRETYGADAFESAALRAYDACEWDGLTEIPGIGESYAQTLALEVAKFYGWEGGDAEPVKIDAMTGDELVETIEDGL